MDVCDKLHIPNLIIPGKEPPAAISQENWWAQSPV